MAHNSPLIIFEHVTKWYPGNVIGLNQCSATIGKGITGLLGPNGAGKSTFLKLATGQIHPNLGRVLIFGVNPFANTGIFNKIGYCPEQDAFWSWMTGKEFLFNLSLVHGFSKGDAQSETKRVLEIVGLDDARADRRIVTYSKGMRQRIKVAQAMIGNPELLILDEPFAGADPITRAHLGKVFERLEKQGISILISSHVLHEVEAFASQIKLMYRGRLLAEGPVKRIRQLIYDHPHRIIIKTKSPRKLAQHLVIESSVSSVEINNGGKEPSLWVLSRKPQEFYRVLPKILVETGISVEEFQSVDDNLQAVFDYLISR